MTERMPPGLATRKIMTSKWMRRIATSRMLRCYQNSKTASEFGQSVIRHGHPRTSDNARLSQHELVRSVLAGNIPENPIKRYLSIIRMTVLARFDFLLGSTDNICVDRDQLNARPRE